MLPSEVIIARTKVPESAEVTRKMKTKATARVLSTGVPGKYSKKKKRAFDTSSNTTSARPPPPYSRSEEHTSELQSLMRISYAVFCLKKKTKTPRQQQSTQSPT